MIDITQLKSRLTPDDIIAIMDSLDTPLYRADEQNCVFYSSCHHPNDPLGHKPRLWYYIESRSFYCWVCHFSGDIIAIVQHLRHCNFNQAIAHICNLLHIEAVEYKQDDSFDNWQVMRRWLPNADIEHTEPLPKYDKRVLSLFDHLYPQDWVEYGISKDTLDKFGIGWYGRLGAISIPVMFDNELVGIRGRFTRKQDTAKGKYKPLTTLDGTTYKFPTGSCFYGYDQNKAAIQRSKTVMLFESEKSVLKAPTYGIDNSLAVFGSNVSKRQIELLVNLGVNDVILAFDSDYQRVGDDEFKYFVAKMKKIIVKLKPYFSVSLIYNNQGYDGYKFSPVDFTRAQFDRLYESKVTV